MYAINLFSMSYPCGCAFREPHYRAYNFFFSLSPEFVTNQDYPPKGVHVNCVDDIYPHENPSPAEKKNMKPAMDSAGLSSPVLTEEMTNAQLEKAEVPRSAAVHSRRDEL